MVPQLFLITPPNATPAGFPAILARVLAAADVSALLVARHALSAADYAALLKAILPVAQEASCAVLTDNDPALAIALRADGVHLPADIDAVETAIADLKPNMIVGAGPFTTRHDAMSIGELDVDYLFFGPTDAVSGADAAELAAWWAQTFEVPAVFSDPTNAASPTAHGAEFLALSTNLWSAPDPAASLAAIAEALAP